MTEHTPNPPQERSSSSSLTDSDPRLIGDRYEVLARLGEGGFGRVYLASDPVINRRVAIKVLRVDDASDALIQRFHKEARAAARLSHPGIVTALDFGLIDHREPYLVMQYVEGRTLSEIFAEVGSLDLSTFKAVFTLVVKALIHAHENDVIHRDLKPSNIVISQRDDELTVHILDFGIAKILDDNSSQELTRTGQIVGSPKYASPEQISAKEQDQRSDIYSLGCVMFESLTGTPPFLGETSIETLQMHLRESPSSLSVRTGGADFSDQFEDLVRTALEKEPEDRFQSMRDLLVALEQLPCEDEEAVEPTSSLEFARPKKRVFLFYSLLVCGVIGGGIAISHALNFNGKPMLKVGKGALRDFGSPLVGSQSAGGSIDNDLTLKSSERKALKQLIDGKVHPGTKELNLHGIRLDKERLQNLANFPDLVSLNLSKTNVDVEMLEFVSEVAPNVETIYLNTTRWKHGELSTLRKFRRLRSLFLEACDLDGEQLAEISEMSTIAGLSIRESTSLRNSEIAQLRKLDNLTTLKVAYTQFTPAGLNSFKGMERLTIEVTGCRGFGQRNLKELCRKYRLLALLYYPQERASAEKDKRLLLDLYKRPTDGSSERTHR